MEQISRRGSAKQNLALFGMRSINRFATVSLPQRLHPEIRIIFLFIFIRNLFFCPIRRTSFYIKHFLHLLKFKRRLFLKKNNILLTKNIIFYNKLNFLDFDLLFATECILLFVLETIFDFTFDALLTNDFDLSFFLSSSFSFNTFPLLIN